MSTSFVYFGYGSNMLSSRLQNRCPSAKVLGVGYVKDYTLTFGKKSTDGSGKGTLEKAPGHIQYGVLFSIDNTEASVLDDFEGYKAGSKTGYDKVVEFPVFDSDNKPVPKVVTYVARKPEQGLKPYGWYLALIIEGARENKLPETFVKELRTVESRIDPDPERESRNNAEDVLWERGTSVHATLQPSGKQIAIHAERIFDGENWHEKSALVISDGRIEMIAPSVDVDKLTHFTRFQVEGGFLAPGLVDLRVFADGAFTPSSDTPTSTVTRICRRQALQGTTSVMLALKSTSSEITSAAMQTVFDAQRRKLLGLLGLHLVGPHLAKEYASGHDQNFIRDMTRDDLEQLTYTETRPSPLLVTVAPESAHPHYIAALVASGVQVGLGHTGADPDMIQACADAGALFTPSLFRDTAPIDGIRPGLSGFALDAGGFSAGVQASAIYPTLLRVAARAKSGRLFFTSDAGSNPNFPDSLSDSLHYAVHDVRIPIDQALQMASVIPAALAYTVDVGVLSPGRLANIVHFDDELRLRATWIGGMRV